MKKTLLTISAGLLISLGSFAQVKSVVADGEQDNGTNVGSFWFAYPNTTQGKSSTILINGKAVDGVADLETSTGGNGGTGNCISASGTLAKTAGPDYESAGTGFALAPIEATLIARVGQPADKLDSVSNSDAVAVDLSAAEGIEFYYKSTAGKLILGVFTTNITQNAGHDYFIELPAATDWTKFTVSFPGSQLEADGVPVLTQPTWLSPLTPWDGSKVFKLQFQVKDVDGDYTFSVDDIAIIGKEIANKVDLSAAWYAADAWVKDVANNATTTQTDEVAAALVVLNNPNALQADVDAQTAILKAITPVSELTADLAVTANEIVISAAKTISSVALINTAGAVVSKVSVGSSVATVSTAAAQGTTVAVIVYADGSVESTTFVK